MTIDLKKFLILEIPNVIMKSIKLNKALIFLLKLYKMPAHIQSHQSNGILNFCLNLSRLTPLIYVNFLTKQILYIVK